MEENIKPVNIISWIDKKIIAQVCLKIGGRLVTENIKFNAKSLEEITKDIMLTTKEVYDQFTDWLEELKQAEGWNKIKSTPIKSNKVSSKWEIKEKTAFEARDEFNDDYKDKE